MKTNQERMRNGIPLRVDVLVKGAKMAVERGVSFDDYCEMVSKVLTAGKPLWLSISVKAVKAILGEMAIDVLFGVCPECGNKMQALDEGNGVCLECGFDNLRVLDDGGGVFHCNS